MNAHDCGPFVLYNSLFLLNVVYVEMLGKEEDMSEASLQSMLPENDITSNDMYSFRLWVSWQILEKADDGRVNSMCERCFTQRFVAPKLFPKLFPL
jgi:hypothetical protein